MNVNHPRTRLVRAQHNAIVLRHPVRRPGNRVHRNLAQVSGLHQIFQGLRRGLFVQCVVIDRLPHDLQVMVQCCFARMLHGFAGVFTGFDGGFEVGFGDCDPDIGWLLDGSSREIADTDFDPRGV